MNRLCKTCQFFSSEDGRTFFCTKLNVQRNATDEAPNDISCWTRKPKPSGEELSLVRSQAGRKGGRPVGSGKGRTPKKQIQIKAMDYLVMAGYAKLKTMTLVDSVHLLAKTLLKQYPQLKPKCWAD